MEAFTIRFSVVKSGNWNMEYLYSVHEIPTFWTLQRGCITLATEEKLEKLILTQTMTFVQT